MNEAHTPWKQSRTTTTLVANSLGSEAEERGMGRSFMCGSVCLFVCSHWDTFTQHVNVNDLLLLVNLPSRGLDQAQNKHLNSQYVSDHCLECLFSSAAHQISRICHGHLSTTMCVAMLSSITIKSIFFKINISLPQEYLPYFFKNS